MSDATSSSSRHSNNSNTGISNNANPPWAHRNSQPSSSAPLLHNLLGSDPSASSSSSQPSLQAQQIAVKLIDCGLPDYLVMSVKRHLPPGEIVDALVQYANDNKIIQAELHGVCFKAKSERDEFKRRLDSREMVPKADYERLKAEKEASDHRVRDYAEDLLSQNDEMDRCRAEIVRLKAEVKEVEGFCQQHLNSIDQLGQDKKQLIAEISSLKSAIAALPPPAATPPKLVNSDLQVKFIKQGNDLANERAKLTEATKKLQELEEVRVKLQSDLDNAVKKCEEFETTLVEKEGIIGSQKDALWRHERNAALSDRQIADLNAKLADLNSELAKWKDDNASLETSLGETSDLRSKLDDQLKKVETLEEQSSAKSIELNQATLDLAAKIKEASEFKLKFEEKSSELDKFKIETSKRIADLDHAAKAVTTSKTQFDKNNSEIDDLKQRNSDLIAKVDQLKKEIVEERDQIVKLKREVQSEKANAALYLSKYEAEKASYATFAQKSKEVSQYRKQTITNQNKVIEEYKAGVRRCGGCGSNRTGSVSAGDLVMITSPNADQVIADAYDEHPTPNSDMSPTFTVNNAKKRKLTDESGQCEVPSASPSGDVDVAGKSNLVADEACRFNVTQEEIQHLKDALQTLAKEVTEQKEIITKLNATIDDLNETNKQLQVKALDADALAVKQFNTDHRNYEALQKKHEMQNQKLDNLKRMISQHLIRLESKTKLSFNVYQERLFLRDTLLQELQLESVEDGECISLIPEDDGKDNDLATTTATSTTEMVTNINNNNNGHQHFDFEMDPPLLYDFRRTLSRNSDHHRDDGEMLVLTTATNDNNPNSHFSSPSNRGSNNNFRGFYHGRGKFNKKRNKNKNRRGTMGGGGGGYNNSGGNDFYTSKNEKQWQSHRAPPPHLQ